MIPVEVVLTGIGLACIVIAALVAKLPVPGEYCDPNCANCALYRRARELDRKEPNGPS